MPPLTAVIVSYNSSRWLPACLDALARSELPVAPVVVDNASTDGSAALVATHYPHVTLIRCDHNFGYGGAANVGFERATEGRALLLNPDVVVEPGTVGALVAGLDSDPRIAVVGAKLLYPDGVTIQHAGGVLSDPLAIPDHRGYRQRDEGQWDEPADVDYVTGALLAIRLEAFPRGRWFDEGFYPAYFEESDLCRRALAAGWRVVYWPARAIHHESVTLEPNSAAYFEPFHRNRLRYVLKHCPADQLWSAFLPAELARLAVVQPPAELRALRLAYEAADAGLAGGGARGLGRADHVEPIGRTRARRQVSRLLALAATEKLREHAEPAPAVPPDLLRSLRTLARLPEPVLIGRMPGLGRLFARARNLWYRGMARWVVRRLSDQQAEMNLALVEALGHVEARLADLERRLTALAADDRRIEWAATEDSGGLESELARIAAALATTSEEVALRLRAVESEQIELDRLLARQARDAGGTEVRLRGLAARLGASRPTAGAGGQRPVEPER